MKARVNLFFRSRVQPRTRLVKENGTRWFLRNSVIFTKLYERQARQKGRIFGMKARLTQFYVNKVEPKLKAVKARWNRFEERLTGWAGAAKARTGQARQQVAGWANRHRRILRIAALVLTALLIAIGLTYLWRRSPAFRAIIRTLGLAALTFWALLKGLGLSLSEGLTALGRSIRWLAANALQLLAEIWSRFTRPIVRIVVVTRQTEAGIPVDGRLS